MLISLKCRTRSLYSDLWRFLSQTWNIFFLLVNFCSGANSSTQTRMKARNMLFYLYVEILESCITPLLIDSLIGTQHFVVFSFFRFPFSELNRKCTLMFEKIWSFARFNSFKVLRTKKTTKNHNKKTKTLWHKQHILHGIKPM